MPLLYVAGKTGSDIKNCTTRTVRQEQARSVHRNPNLYHLSISQSMYQPQNVVGRTPSIMDERTNKHRPSPPMAGLIRTSHCARCPHIN